MRTEIDHTGLALIMSEIAVNNGMDLWKEDLMDCKNPSMLSFLLPGHKILCCKHLYLI